MKKLDKFLAEYFDLNDDQLNDIDLHVAECLYDNIANGNIDKVKKLMKKYAKRRLIEADNMFDWDHDMELWTGDYKPSEL